MTYAKLRKPLGQKRSVPFAVDHSIFWAGVHVFCDGACEPNPGAGGWAFVVYEDGVEVHKAYGGEVVTTNNIMEMTGALRALKWMAENHQGRPFQLHCDSRYVVDGCNVWRHGWKRKGWLKGKPSLKNAALWQDLDAVLSEMPIKLNWVKGHAGIPGNERADKLSFRGRLVALRDGESEDSI
jgi:ribonuclease HI